MAKLRKMLGDIHSQESIALMRLIETQNKFTLASWSISYAKKYYLPIFKKKCPDDLQLEETIAACEGCLAGEKTRSEAKALLKGARQSAAKIQDAAAQAAARAITTACAAIQTPTNAFGFLLYGAAAVAYDRAGLEEKPDVYDRLASLELSGALDSLKKTAVPNEPNPVKINWYC